MNQNEPPQVLWHYTTQEGLRGIIESGSLHATNIFYLNDATEYTYAEEVIIDVLNGYLDDLKKPVTLYSAIEVRAEEQGEPFQNPGLSSDTEKYLFIEILRDSIKDLRFDPIYILSFSAKEDDLSQWRGYCPHGNGFCIGFKATKLYTQFKRKTHLPFLKCIYNRSEQEDKIRKTIDASMNKQLEIKELVRQTIVDFLDIIPQMKDSSFENEEEWRLIFIKTTDIAVSFRAGKSMLVPYVKIALGSQTWGNAMALDSVIVGPTPHKELSKKSVESLLRTNSIKLKTNKADDGCDVKLSKIPYRIL